MNLFMFKDFIFFEKAKVMFFSLNTKIYKVNKRMYVDDFF